MKLITAAIAVQLARNTAQTEAWEGCDSDIPEKFQNKPVLKLFNPCGDGTWLISEMDADGMMFGLCDLGHGSPELGYVSLDEIKSVRLPFGLRIERDRSFKPRKTLAAYARAATLIGHIKA